jgi:hypothetical protein
LRRRSILGPVPVRVLAVRLSRRRRRSPTARRGRSLDRSRRLSVVVAIAAAATACGGQSAGGLSDSPSGGSASPLQGVHEYIVSVKSTDGGRSDVRVWLDSENRAYRWTALDSQGHGGVTCVFNGRMARAVVPGPGGLGVVSYDEGSSAAVALLAGHIAVTAALASQDGRALPRGTAVRRLRASAELPRGVFHLPSGKPLLDVRAVSPSLAASKGFWLGRTWHGSRPTVGALTYTATHELYASAVVYPGVSVVTFMSSGSNQGRILLGTQTTRLGHGIEVAATVPMAADGSFALRWRSANGTIRDIGYNFDPEFNSLAGAGRVALAISAPPRLVIVSGEKLTPSELRKMWTALRPV